MALLSAPTPNKRRLFAASKPDYKDFSGPPNGDYVRYVEGLMAWSEQEQERLRLKALGDKARATPDADWGRAPAAGARSASVAQPGSVDHPLQQLSRKAKAHVDKQQAAQAAKAQGRTTQTSVPKGNPLVMLVLGVAAVALIFFGVPEMLPTVIIAWVIYNVIRAVRAASSSTKS